MATGSSSVESQNGKHPFFPETKGYLVVPTTQRPAVEEAQLPKAR
jgi:hypothetical protein